MKRILLTSWWALIIVILISANGATAVQLNDQQTAEQAAPPPGFPLATLRRDFKDSIPIPVGARLVYEVKSSRFPLKATVGQVTFEYLGPITSKPADENPATGDSEPLLSGLNVPFTPQPGDQFLHLRATAVSKGLLVAILGTDVKDRFE